MARIVMPLPDVDFDTTEVAVPWKLFVEAGHEVTFLTERAGTVPACDPLLLTGVLFGKLGAEPEPKAFYAELTKHPAFLHTRAWNELDAANFDCLVLAGGHAPGMRQYLGSALLHEKVAAFVAAGKPFGAICHGPVVLARSKVNGVSVLSGRKTSCLPKYMERAAYFSSAWKLGRYYRTYPEYVEDEVAASGATVVKGPFELSKRGTRTDDSPAFVVEDGNYVSARWPGDSYLFAKKVLARL